MLGMRGFYNASVGHLLSRLPFENQLLYDVRILNPKHRTDAGCLKSVERLAQKFCQSDYDTILDEWKLYQQETNVPSILVSSTDNDSQKCSKRVDRYWNEISALKTAADKPKYAHLTKLVRVLVVIPHGNADVERGLSVAKRSLTDDRANLSIESIIANRVVKDAAKFHDPGLMRPERIPLTRELCLAAHNAHAAYIKRVEEDERKKAENKKKTLADKAEEERLQIAAEKASCDKSGHFSARQETVITRDRTTSRY